MDITLSYLIGLALMLSLVSLISAVLVRLGARAILQEQVGFRKAFWVSFAAFGIGLFLQKVIGEAAGPFSAIAIFGRLAMSLSSSAICSCEDGSFS